MTTLNVHQEVRAPLSKTFATFSDFASFPRHVAAIRLVEMTTSVPVRVGTRFRATRAVDGKTSQPVELEVVSFEPDRSFALATESRGVRVTSLFEFSAGPESTKVDVTVTAEARTFAAKLMMPAAKLVMGAVKAELAADFAALARAAEKSTS